MHLEDCRAKLYLSHRGKINAEPNGEKFSLTGEDCMERAATVLIADSTEEFTNALSAALQRTEGFQVVGTAADGEQAIRLIGERKPDLLVLDMMLSSQLICFLQQWYSFHLKTDILTVNLNIHLQNSAHRVLPYY